jgi:hypothetical protein
MYAYTIKIFGQYILVAIITNNPNKQNQCHNLARKKTRKKHLRGKQAQDVYM